KMFSALDAVLIASGFCAVILITTCVVLVTGADNLFSGAEKIFSAPENFVNSLLVFLSELGKPALGIGNVGA
ncbi:MAG: hypothetical protein IJ637_09770, partial [Prevotella sp.]|nr:hypothetical protein [Prevotella sp.]